MSCLIHSAKAETMGGTPPLLDQKAIESFQKKQKDFQAFIDAAHYYYDDKEHHYAALLEAPEKIFEVFHQLNTPQQLGFLRAEYGLLAAAISPTFVSYLQKLNKETILGDRQKAFSTFTLSYALSPQDFVALLREDFRKRAPSQFVTNAYILCLQSQPELMKYMELSDFRLLFNRISTKDINSQLDFLVHQMNDRDYSFTTGDFQKMDRHLPYPFYMELLLKSQATGIDNFIQTAPVIKQDDRFLLRVEKGLIPADGNYQKIINSLLTTQLTKPLFWQKIKQLYQNETKDEGIKIITQVICESVERNKTKIPLDNALLLADLVNPHNLEPTFCQKLIETKVDSDKEAAFGVFLGYLAEKNQNELRAQFLFDKNISFDKAEFTNRIPEIYNQMSSPPQKKRLARWLSNCFQASANAQNFGGALAVMAQDLSEKEVENVTSVLFVRNDRQIKGRIEEISAADLKNEKVVTALTKSSCEAFLDSDNETGISYPQLLTENASGALLKCATFQKLAKKEKDLIWKTLEVERMKEATYQENTALIKTIALDGNKEDYQKLWQLFRKWHQVEPELNSLNQGVTEDQLVLTLAELKLKLQHEQQVS